MPAKFDTFTVPCPHCSQQIAFSQFLVNLDKAVIPKLSRTERIVAIHSAKGLNVKEIADLLRNSPKTIEVHKYQAYQKLGVHNMLELVFALIACIPQPVGGPNSNVHSSPM